MRFAFRWPVVAAVALTFLAAVQFHAIAAGGSTCTALIGGAEASKKLAPELVLFNTTSGTFSLDLTLRNAAGDVLVSRAGELDLGAFQTLAVDLNEQLTRDLAPKTKPYEGVFSIEITGDAPFGPNNVLVHLTQFHGKRKAPKAAFVLPATFRSDE